MPDHGPAESSRLHARVRIGYGLGSFATGTFGTVPGLLLLYYLTDILGVAAGVAGLLVFLPKAWDVLLNPWIGSLSDRTIHRWGPRRPWMLLGALTMPLCFAAMFAVPSALQRGWAAAWVTVLFLLTATAYACFQVPYVALPAELTADPGERARVMSWRIAFLGAAILLSGATAPLLAGASADGPGSPDGYRFMGLVIGCVLMLGMLAAFAATAGVHGVAEPVAEPTLLAQLRATRGNRPFACLIVPCLLAMPLWLALGLRTGKRAAAIAASLCFLTGALSTAFAPILPLAAVYAAVALAGVGYAGMQMLPPAMLGDAIAADGLTSGRRRAGVFTGLWTAGETLGLALGPGLFGLVLSAGGFVSSDAAHRVDQPESALTAILAGFGVLPALLLLVSLPLLGRYDLTEAELGRLRGAARARDTPPAPAIDTESP
ncbi:MFS transporter [Streptomyces meridianus]|uniref:MFS transporter n=1 Tax=Streptomyces meridianus TaxID=2938945 RepID=A0ABT0XAC8_9ACTN|nr:MFS transporter [Streptomyces meridianus]MCM2579471.1 MFS transporter [Streptomyces meridianus]